MKNWCEDLGHDRLDRARLPDSNENMFFASKYELEDFSDHTLDIKRDIYFVCYYLVHSLKYILGLQAETHVYIAETSFLMCTRCNFFSKHIILAVNVERNLLQYQFMSAEQGYEQLVVVP